MYIFDRLRDKLAERRIEKSIEGIFRMYLMKSELGRLYGPREYQSIKPMHPKTSNDDGRLGERRQRRKDGKLLTDRLEYAIRYNSSTPIEALQPVLYLASVYRSRAFIEYLKRPELFKAKKKEFVEKVEAHIRNQELVSLERRIYDLEKRLAKGYYVPVDHAAGSDSVRDEIVKEYATNYKSSLKDIAGRLSSKYTRNISERSMRTEARKILGDVSRRDRSAKRAYETLQSRKQVYRKK
jgi:hypothetical protein